MKVFSHFCAWDNIKVIKLIVNNKIRNYDSKCLQNIANHIVLVWVILRIFPVKYINFCLGNICFGLQWKVYTVAVGSLYKRSIFFSLHDV